MEELEYLLIELGKHPDAMPIRIGDLKKMIKKVIKDMEDGDRFEGSEVDLY